MTHSNISNNSIGVSLYPKIKISFDQNLNDAELSLVESDTNNPVPGIIEVENNTITYQPINVLLPDSRYNLYAKGVATTNEPSEDIKISFSTKEVGERYWLDVKLGEIHTLTVYKGRYPIRFMLASGGRTGHETPLGTYYTGDRGSSFWSAKFGEGATYWVRVVGNILIHSVPKNSSWETKEEEHNKLGLPASHGCIRLSEQDAKWVYENIPSNTMLIIHN